MEYLRHLPFLLRTLALVMIVIAIARPRSSEQMEKVDTEGIDIVLAMDVSTSMLARDFAPDRINAAKDIALNSYPRGLPTEWELSFSPGNPSPSVRLLPTGQHSSTS